MREGGSVKWLSREVTCYVRREGLVMRCWKPKNHVSDGEEVLHLVLPEVPNQCREAVLRLAHEIPLSGHLGKEKTVERVLRRLYWPTLHRDVAEWCPECQKTSWASGPLQQGSLDSIAYCGGTVFPYSEGHRRPSPSKQIWQQVYSAWWCVITQPDILKLCH